MRISGSIGLFATLALIATSAPGEARADLIIGNMPPTYTSPTYNTNGQVNTGLGLDYAVEFSASSTETVSTATLVLSIQAGTTPTLGIYNATGAGAIGSLVGSFTDSSLIYGTAVTETFKGTATLTGGKNYFLVLDGNNYFNWSSTYTAANPSGLIPTGPGATYMAAGGSGSYAAGNVKPSFALATPEPSALVLAGTGGLFALAVWYRRSAATA